MRLKPSCRKYRLSFPRNYQGMVGSSDARSYIVEILEAALQPQPSIWLNGEHYQLTEETLCRASAVKASWFQLAGLICSSDHCWRDGSKRKALSDFDEAWAAFEQSYIQDLVSIDNAAKEQLLDAVSSNQRLRSLEVALDIDDDTEQASKAVVQEEVFLLRSIA